MVPNLIILVKDIERLIGKPVGIYQEAWTLQWGESVVFRGTTKTEGQHYVDNISMLFVEMYNDEYADQIGKLDDWIAYANQGINRPLIYGISLVNQNSSDENSYWQETYSAMEAAHSEIKDEFVDSLDYESTTFRGNGVHHYSDYCRWLENQSLWDCSFYP
jgi:hypothetical protein